MTAREFNFDGLVGPTHNYSGLAFGNVASTTNAEAVSNPRLAAQQGLDKMKALADLGLGQGVLAPHERPDMGLLRSAGFSGFDEAVLADAARKAPRLLRAAGSASSMWAANAATISPSADTGDRRVHLTVANLAGQLHRSIEAPTTARILKAVFPEGELFAHHAPLPAAAEFGDEGAANHTRLAAAHDTPGVELFVYGRSGFDASDATRYPARQTLAASQAVARRHGLENERVVFAQQNPSAIDGGVFHNDVIAVGHLDVLLYHEDAFVGPVLDELRAALDLVPLRAVEVPRDAIRLADAVESYLFNSQLVSLPSGEILLVAPAEIRRNDKVSAHVDEIVEGESPIDQVLTFDLRQSMRNGGGPACLRFRAVLTAQEEQAINSAVILNDDLYASLSSWINRHYRDELSFRDLSDHLLLDESRRALDELSSLLGLGSVYPFQL